MAYIQIPNLPAVTSLAGAELFEGVQAGTSFKISLTQIIAATRVGLPTPLPIPVIVGGTGAVTLTGYVKGSGTSPLTASATIPNTDITGLGTMSTQNANAVAITGGSINGTPIGGSTPAAVTGTTVTGTSLVSTGGLTVSGASVISVNSASDALRITQTGAGNALVVEDSTNPDSTPFVVTGAGNVGIGTTTPAAQLHVSGNTSLIAQFTASISGTTMTVTAFTTGDGLIAVGDIVYGAGVSPITKITSLGTGTGSTGTYNVSVSQTVSSSASIFTGSPTASRIRIADTDTTTSLGQPTGSIEFFGSDTTAPTAGVGAYLSAISESSSPDTTLTFGTRDAAVGAVDANERMRIDSSGNVGIGTINPLTPLNVQGSFSTVTTNTASIAIFENANSTATASTRIALRSDQGDTLRERVYLEAGREGTSGGYLGIWTRPDGSAITEKMRITSAGNVGIGTTTPATQLHVEGNTTSIASITSASITGITLTVVSVSANTIAVGDRVYGVGVAPLTRIVSQNSGTTGGAGTYTVSVYQTAPGPTMYTSSGTAATVRITDTDGTVLAGQPSGTIEFFVSDINTPTPGVGAYISAVSEDSIPDTSLTFGTRESFVGGGVDANERMRIGSVGQIGLGGANYGTSGQTIVSAGSAAAPAWGTLPVAGGGTGVTTSTGTGAVVLGTGPTITAAALNGTVGATTPSTGAFTTVTASTSVLSSGTGGIGYATGAGVAVTQLTSRTTTTPTTNGSKSGAVTLFTTTAVVGTYFSFTVPNTGIAVTDTVVLSVRGATNTYTASVTAITAATSFQITMASVAGTASDTPIVNFTIIKGVSA